MADDEAQIAARQPVSRLGRPEDVAKLVLFLASPRAAFVIGAYYPGDGRHLAQ